MFNVFRMFSRMGATRVGAVSDGAADLDEMLKTGVRAKPDVGALASRDARRVTILVWHYHDDDVAGPAADVALTLEGLEARSGQAQLRHFRIDADHSNAYTAWQRMGSLAAPTPAQYTQLEQASNLVAMKGPPIVKVDQGRASLRFPLPRQAVSLLVIEW